jgi:phosphoribosyl 1,2-cyclic phosphodiesterase
MKFCSLASGSAGNSTFIASGTTRILVDAGLSVKTLKARLVDIGECIENLSAVLVTHRHNDHISGLARLVRYGIKRGRAIPVYLTGPTSEVIDWDGLEHPPVAIFNAGTPFSIGDIGVDSFTIPHDCVDPVGFTFSQNGSKIGFAHDLGFVPDAARYKFRDCQALMLESNHDIEMLRVGPHPNEVKLRVSGRYGHLSNAENHAYLGSEAPAGLRHLVLTHLSRDNNFPLLAETGAVEELRRRGIAATVTVAGQDRRTDLLTI